MSSQKPQSFDALMKQIEEHVTRLQDPHTSLEESLKLFDATSALIADARRRLAKMEHHFQTIQAKSGPLEPGPGESA
ncbi:exodeoxyribonuclease VII small subunit [Candidatus Berkelbacteria bacterium]|nr:exodeoxyribonuclease VII small subunit [Candidatus Berkelbacteria bacterium]